jgi:hypothetical protein
MTAPADPVTARRRLAAAQTQLLAALVSGAPSPPGFDPDRLRAQTDALVAKRRELVARLRPDLVEAGGAQFTARFDRYARTHPRPMEGARADADAFAAALEASPATPLAADAAPSHRRDRTGIRRHPSHTVAATDPPCKTPPRLPTLPPARGLQTLHHLLAAATRSRGRCHRERCS